LEGTIFIPKSVQSIWQHTFYWAFSWNTDNYIEFEEWSQLTSIWDRAFQSNNFKWVLKIPSKLTFLWSQFYWNYFTWIDLTEARSLTEIWSSAFWWYWSYEHFYSFEWTLFIPKSVQTIWQHAFNSAFSWDTDNYIEFEEWSQLTSIWASAFQSNNFKWVLKIPGNLGVIWEEFKGSHFTWINLSEADSLTGILANAFYNMWTVEWDLVIPNSVETIWNSAFHNTFTWNNNTLTLWTWLITIGSNAFYWDNFQWTIFLPSSITAIGWQAFRTNTW
jgi:cation transport regulator ChaB